MEPLDEPTRRRLLRNARLSCVSHAFLMALFPIATLSLFLTHDLGLTVADVFLLQATFGFFVALLEVPSGYLADRIGYRITMVIGAVLGAAGWVAYCFTEGFATALIAEVMLAVGVSFISGTDSAMLYESLRGLKREGEFGTWFSRMRASGNAAEGSAALLGAWLYTQSVRVPFAVQAAVWFANVLVVLAFVEPARDRGPELQPLERCRMIVRFAAQGAPRLRKLFGLFLALSIPPYVMVWVLPVYVEAAGNDVALIGPIWAASSYVTAFFTWLAPKLELRFGSTPVLGACAAAIALGYGGMAVSDAQWAWVFVFALCFTRGAQHPILAHAEQTMIPSSDRAALLSIKSLLFRGAFVIVGPFVGSMIDAQGMKLTLAVSGVLFVLLAGLAWSAYSAAPQASPEPSVAS
jgi:MFS family permease